MDELLLAAIEEILENEMASKAMLQRKLRIGYERAKKLIDVIEAMGIIGPEKKDQPRQIYMTLDEWLSILENRNLRMQCNPHNNLKSDEQAIVNNDISQVSRSLTEVWDRACRYLENELQPMNFNTWIRTIQPVEVDGRLLLVVPNDFNKDIVVNRYSSLIISSLNYAAEEPVTMEVVTNK